MSKLSKEDLLKKLKIKEIRKLIESKKNDKEFVSLALKIIKEKKIALKNKKLKNENNIIDSSKNKKSRKSVKIDLQKAISEQGKIESERRGEYKKSIRKEIESAKLEREIKLILNRELDEMEKNMKNHFEKLFVDEVKKLKERGMKYVVEYKELTLADISKTGIRTLGKDGWRYCFENNGRITFERTLEGK